MRHHPKIVLVGIGVAEAGFSTTGFIDSLFVAFFLVFALAVSFKTRCQQTDLLSLCFNTCFGINVAHMGAGRIDADVQFFSRFANGLTVINSTC